MREDTPEFTVARCRKCGRILTATELHRGTCANEPQCVKRQDKGTAR